MTKRSLCKAAVASLAVVACLQVAQARADVGWIMQSSSSPVVFSGSIGDTVFNYNDGTLGDAIRDSNGNIEWIQKYDGIPQATSQFNPANQVWTDANFNTFPGIDPNWGPYAGYTNSAQTSASGTFKSIGNNFLSSLNLGPRPVVNDYNNFHPTTQFAFSGNYYPQADGAPGGGTYGNATPSQTALTFVGAAGANIFANGTAGQKATYGTVLSPVPGGGPLDTGYGPTGHGTAGVAALTGTGGYASSNNNTFVVSPTGTFDAHGVNFTGVLAFSASFQADNGASQTSSFSPSGFFGLVNQLSGFTNGLLTISNDLSGAAAQGTITRGVGAHASDYLMTVPYSASMQFGTGNGDKGILTGQPDPGNGNNPYPAGVGTAVFLDLHFTATFIAKANLAAGDANFDGIVNGQDIALIASNWLATDAAHKLSPGDVNGDGIVNGQDIALIASNWLATSPPLPGEGAANAAAVPEPGTWILLGLGTLILAVRRKLV